MLIKNAEIYRESGKFSTGSIFLCEDRIQRVEEGTFSGCEAESGAGCTDNTEIIDARGLYAIPGLTDLHFHGCAGYDFCDGTKEALQAIAEYEARNGITTICPATMTLPEDRLAQIYSNAADYDSERGAVLCGIHMEGPFLSENKKGAQNAAYLRKPDIGMYERLNRLSGNLIKLVSIAPEEDGAIEFIHHCNNSVVLSLAHTEADYDTAWKAFQAGASHVTHLYNAMPPFHHRNPGVIGAAFDSPDSRVELICDGIHLHPSVVRAAAKMFGEDRIILVSDSMMAAGLPDGTYALGGQEVHVTGKKAELADGTIAGSVTNLMECMKNAVRDMKLPFEMAIKAAAVNPAKEIGIYDRYGSITARKIANIVLLDKEYNVRMVILKGQLLTK